MSHKTIWNTCHKCRKHFPGNVVEYECLNCKFKQCKICDNTGYSKIKPGEYCECDYGTNQYNLDLFYDS